MLCSNSSTHSEYPSTKLHHRPDDANAYVQRNSGAHHGIDAHRNNAAVLRAGTNHH